MQKNMKTSGSGRILRPEILAPAGDAVSLRAALNAGADAVYFGITGFNMRAGARNFSLTDMIWVASDSHEYGAKAYLALNTLIYEHERTTMKQTVEAAADAGVDAIICWDPAVIQAAGEAELDIHLSTQASVANSDGIVFYHRNYGIRRFVLARECSLSDIRQIRESLNNQLGTQADTIELEAFVHGAMCVSVSGRCFLSESVTGKSGNRGECLQPCRREYRIVDVEGEYEYEVGRDYVLSPKDLCTLPFIEKILESGIASLKIEGRNRNPEYVSTVVSSYRRAVDHYFQLKQSGSYRQDSPEWKSFEELKRSLTRDMTSVFNRGFSSGFYMGKPVDAWSGKSDSHAGRRKESVGMVTHYYQKIGIAVIRVQAASFEVGDELIVQGPTTGSLSVQVEAIEVDHESVPKASKGMDVAVAVCERVRMNDLVFRRYAVES